MTEKTSNLSSADVAKLGQLARIRLSPQEQQQAANNLSAVFALFQQLDEVDTDGVPPMTSVAHLTLPMRKDEVTDGDRRDEVLSNAPVADSGFFGVPKVIEV